MNSQKRLVRSLSQLSADGKMWSMKWLSAWRRVTGSSPFASVAIETSTHCHRRCGYCPVSINPKSKLFIKPQVFTRILNQLNTISFNGRLTYHHYNEPLLNENLELLVAEACRALPAAKHVIYTSGDQLTDRRRDSLSAAGVDQFVVTDHGGRELRPSVSKAAKLSPVPYKSIRFRKIVDSSALYNRGGMVEVKNVREQKYCAYPAYEMVIDIKGNVLLCCNDYNGDHQFGNVMEQELIDIWHSPAMSQIRHQLLKGIAVRPICKACMGHQ